MEGNMNAEHEERWRRLDEDFGDNLKCIKRTEGCIGRNYVL